MRQLLFLGLTMVFLGISTATAEAQIFGGRSNDPLGGIISGRPNGLGGMDFIGPRGFIGSSRPNVLGGQDFIPSSGGGIISGRPNVFGGMDFSGPRGSIGSSMPNVFGGFDFFGR
jgi:hypothetical protein